MKIYLIFFLFTIIHSSKFIEMIGMGYLLQGLAIPVSSLDQFNSTSTGYMLDPNINIFLTQFNTRTQLCNYKCTSIFNLPCFLLFGCNIHVRNFILIFLLPFLMVTLIAVCCRKKIWTFGCWWKYFTVFTKISFIFWIFKKCTNGAKIRERKQKLKIQLCNEKVLNQKQFNYEIQPCLTEEKCKKSILVTKQQKQ